MVRHRSSSSSSRWRVLHPSYYLKRPRRLALLAIIFVCATVLIWDRQTLAREHEAEISKLIEENNQLQNQLKDIMKYAEETGKEISFPRKHEENMQETSVNTKDGVNVERQKKVKAAMLHAWTAYEKYAWGSDELQPQSRRGVNNFGGLGASIIDSIDTLYIMGLDEQFQKAKEWVTNSLDFNKDVDASVFETTIRVVGGLLSAYDLSGDGIFLQRAREIADRLLPAWNTPSGIPYNTINLAHGNAHNPGWTGGASILADSGTEQLEFIALSQRTGDFKYQEKVENVIKKFQSILPDDGLLPIYINPHSGQAETYAKITFGAMGDSFYEYLLKVWIQGNKTDAVKHYRDTWEKSMEGLMKLIRKSSPSSYTYIAERSGNSLIDKMDELACFTPGMLALGAGHDDSEKALMYLKLAKELTRTCYNFYNSTRTKLAGENYIFNEGEDMVVGTSWNILRPETVESLMYLWRITGDEIYREWGWDIFQAFETQSRIDSGYVGLKDVNSGEKDDTMQSFFLAETLKYLYLLFSPPSVIPLDQWVFNTEAHPLKITSRLGSEQNIKGNQFSQHTQEAERDQRLGGKFDALSQIKNNIMERAKRRERLFGRKEGRSLKSVDI